ncbi:MAG: glycoside hydrolase family 57 protein [Verrucomicrobia bacterium]|nr:glycoside hydrolase family 57 protein [Verrucomicrobiota bacterium]
MANVAFLWHMHQPYYVNPLTRVATMPWVRLHSVKGYLDMISLIADYPGVRLNFNLTPVLLLQIEEIVEGRVTDLWLERARKPAADLDESEQIALLQDFFKANWATMVKPEPRYAELLHKRGEHPRRDELPQIARHFTRQDFLDLQVWFNLAWCGFTALARYPELAALRQKGRHFTEAEKGRLLEIHLEIMRSLPGAYRAAEERGQVELTTTPFFHPILPLIYDTALAERSLPGREFPHRFHWPQDAEAQLTLAIENHERLFGRRPRGLWPSEGSIAPEMIPLMQQVGIQYFCSDEENLFKSIHSDPAYAHTRVEHLELFQGWQIRHDGASVNGVFRDRPLSDFIGFTAARNPPEQAARHLTEHLLHIAGHIPAEHGLIPIILDGENAWENFPDSGEAFLRALYAGIAADPVRLRSCTLDTYFREHPPIRGLNTLHTGSWIGSNFDIWIGEPEENRAWDLLGQTRSFLQQQIDAGKLEESEKTAALHEIYAAEGSDWFWWYGPDFSTENDALFDDLFRQHLKNVYLLCDVLPPAELDVPIAGYTPPLFRPPQRHISPCLGDWDASRLEWLAAGTYLPGAEQGAMHRSGRFVKKLWFGCDKAHLYLRLDFAQPEQIPPIALLLTVTRSGNSKCLQARTAVLRKPGSHSFTILGKPGHHATLTLGQYLEWKLALADLDLPPGAPFTFQLALLSDGIEQERYPEQAPIPLRA